jgi:hypothetical protein
MSTVFCVILLCVRRDLAMDQSPTQEVLSSFTVSEGNIKNGTGQMIIYQGYSLLRSDAM